ncbi:MAG: thioredoxin [Anaerolineae bacterium]
MAETKTFDVTEATFKAEVLDSELPVLIDFWAEWCGPCKMIEPHVMALAEEYAGKMRVGRLDADENPNIMMEYGIMGIPTLILFKNGQPVERLTGYMPKERIISKLEPHLG